MVAKLQRIILRPDRLRSMRKALSVKWGVVIGGRRVVASRLMGADEYITKEQAAGLLCVTTRQILRYVDDGLLTKFANSSGHVRYCRRQVEDFRRRRDQFVPVRKAC